MLTYLVAALLVAVLANAQYYGGPSRSRYGGRGDQPHSVFLAQQTENRRRSYVNHEGNVNYGSRRYHGGRYYGGPGRLSYYGGGDYEDDYADDYEGEEPGYDIEDRPIRRRYGGRLGGHRGHRHFYDGGPRMYRDDGVNADVDDRNGGVGNFGSYMLSQNPLVGG